MRTKRVLFVYIHVQVETYMNGFDINIEIL